MQTSSCFLLQIALAGICPCHTLCELLPKGRAWGFNVLLDESRTACHAWGDIHTETQFTLPTAHGLPFGGIRKPGVTHSEELLCSPHQHAPTALASFICRLSAKHRTFRFSDLRAQEGRDAQSLAGQFPK
jgi:hypothetical protein